MKKLFILFIVLTFFVCGCDNDSIANQNSSVSTSQDNATSTVAPSETDVPDDQTTETSGETSVDKDVAIKSFFSTAKNNVSSYIENDAADDAKNTFIKLVDFIFYDGEINGIKFSELKDDTKEKIISETISISSSINTKWPGLLDKIADVSNKVYKDAVSKLKDLDSYYNNKIKETIGDDAYDIASDKANETKDAAKNVIGEVIDEAKDIGSSIIDSVTSWYNNLKKNN